MYNFNDADSKIFVDFNLKNDANSDSAFLQNATQSAGTGSVNLATGQLSFAKIDSVSGNKAMPIVISHHYNQSLATSDFAKNGSQFHCGYGWKLNYQQTLVANREIFDSNGETSNRFCWTNAEGNEIVFDEKYYYLDSNKKRVYVDESDVTIEADGRLTSSNKEVTKECVSDDGCVLEAEPTRIENIEIINNDSEEIANLKNQKATLVKAIEQLEGTGSTPTSFSGQKELMFHSFVNNIINNMSEVYSLSDKIDYDELNNKVIEFINKSVELNCLSSSNGNILKEHMSNVKQYAPLIKFETFSANQGLIQINAGIDHLFYTLGLFSNSLI